MRGTMRTIAAVIASGVAASGVMMEGRDGAKVLAKPTLKHALLDHFIVVPEQKLLFCYIDKVGCMNFNDLFRRVRGKNEPKQLRGGLWCKNTPGHHNLTKADLENILVDDTWHKAVFWRDPVERFASAFQSKCDHANSDGAHHCIAQFGVPELPFDSAVAFMARADYKAARQDVVYNDSDDDVHFKLQGGFCGGLEHTLQYYNTVQELDQQTSHDKVAELLKAVGVDPQGVDKFDALFPPPGQHLRALTNTTNGWKRQEPEHHHNTNAAAAKATLLPADQPWLEATIFEHYKSDFELFGKSAAAAYRQGAPSGWTWPLEDTIWELDASLPPAP